MGYIAKSIAVSEVEKEFAKTSFVDIERLMIEGTSETIVYKATHDFTDLDKILVIAYGNAEAGVQNGLVKVYFDTTLKKTFTFTQGGSAQYEYDTIDVSGSTTEIVKIGITGTNTSAGMIATVIKVFGQEA